MPRAWSGCISKKELVFRSIAISFSSPSSSSSNVGVLCSFCRFDSLGAESGEVEERARFPIRTGTRK